MHKDFIPPVSIEEFAAYLDGNLSNDEMKAVSSVIANDDAMQDIVLNSQTIDETLSNCEPLDLMLPDNLSSIDFEIPQFEDTNDDNWNQLEVAAYAPDVPYCETSIEDDDSTTDYDDNDFLHHTNIDDTLNDINNDYSQEHNAIEDSIPDITE